MSERQTFFGALTGRTRGDVSGMGQDVRAQLEAAFGTRRGRLDTAAAAAGMGVSQRTVQRWVASEGRQRSRPSPAHRQQLQKRSRQAATTKRGRRRALAQARAAIPARRATDLRIHGTQGPRRAGVDYTRARRSSTVEMTPQTYQQLLDAYEQGGESGARSFLEGLWDQEYVQDWRFTSISDMDWLD